MLALDVLHLYDASVVGLTIDACLHSIERGWLVEDLSVAASAPSVSCLTLWLGGRDQSLVALLVLIALAVDDCLRLCRVELLEVEELLGEKEDTIQCDDVGPMLLTLGAEAAGEGPQAAVALSAAPSQPDVHGHAGFARLDRQRLVSQPLAAQKHGVLQLHQGAELGFIVDEVVAAVCSLLDVGVTPGDRDVVSHANVAVCSPAYFDPIARGMLLPVLERLQVFCVDDVENFGVFVREALQDDVVSLWLVDSNDVHDLVLVGYLEGEVGIAQLAVELVEFQDCLAAVLFALASRVKPPSETLQMDQTHGAGTLAWRDKGIWLRALLLVLLVLLLRAPADTAHCLVALLCQLRRTDSSGLAVTLRQDDDLAVLVYNLGRLPLLVRLQRFGL